MIVVADTSVILNLCCVKHEEILRNLFRRVLIPAKVAEEFKRLSQVQSRFGNVELPDWLEVAADPQSIRKEVLNANLDAGEATAIELCLTLGADALLIDEAIGRRVAHQLGVRTTGVLGILIESKRRGYLREVKEVLDKLEQQAGFWINPKLRLKVLKLAGE